jgi:hypothetical protein
MMDLHTMTGEGWSGGATNGGRDVPFLQLHTWAQAARELPRYLLIEYCLSIIAQNRRIESRKRHVFSLSDVCAR